MSNEQKTERYHVSLRKDFEAPRRSRGGITVAAGPGEELDLTAEQVAALQGDREFTLRKVTTKEAKAREEAEAEATKAQAEADKARAKAASEKPQGKGVVKNLVEGSESKEA